MRLCERPVQVQWVGADDAARPVLAIRLGPALRSCDAAAALRFAEAVSCVPLVIMLEPQKQS